MATTADIRNGMVITYKDQLMKVVSFLHVKPGKGGAFVRTRLKNVISGNVVDVTFRSGERIDPVRLESREMQVLYFQEDSFVFMDLENYEQVQVPRKVLEEDSKFIQDGLTVELEFVDSKVIGIKLPVFVEMKVTETEPGFRGNTATGGSKPAVLETGHTVAVPLFVSVGDMLRIDTRTGEYVERVK
ncbi:MAG: elongation factor P [Fidelibacterota bacterium]